MTRCCYDCGARGDQATFGGTRKPRGRRDRCTDCASNPLHASLERVAVRLAEIQARRAAGRYRAPKPFHTMPLFAGLRTDMSPGGDD